MAATRQPMESAGALGAGAVASLVHGSDRLTQAHEAARRLEAEGAALKDQLAARLHELELEAFAAEVRAEEAEARAADARACLKDLADAVAARLASERADGMERRAA